MFADVRIQSTRSGNSREFTHVNIFDLHLWLSLSSYFHLIPGHVLLVCAWLFYVTRYHLAVPYCVLCFENTPCTHRPATLAWLGHPTAQLSPCSRLVGCCCYSTLGKKRGSFQCGIFSIALLSWAEANAMGKVALE